MLLKEFCIFLYREMKMVESKAGIPLFRYGLQWEYDLKFKFNFVAQ
jgi:hypothetical protein